jgi:hypothetical protein
MYSAVPLTELAFEKAPAMTALAAASFGVNPRPPRVVLVLDEADESDDADDAFGRPTADWVGAPGLP